MMTTGIATTIYWISGSSPAWRVLMALELKGVKYASRILQTSKKEQKERWFLDINPRGTVPVLQDGDCVVRESLAILNYLEARYPVIPLLGSSPVAIARIAQTMHELLNCADKLLGDVVQPVFRNKVDESMDAIRTAAGKSHDELAHWELLLQRQDWLADDLVSAADIALVPAWQRLLRAMARRPDVAAGIEFGDIETRYPGLSAWNARIESLPAFDASFPPHRRE